jgi:hypothetical protein
MKNLGTWKYLNWMGQNQEFKAVVPETNKQSWYIVAYKDGIIKDGTFNFDYADLQSKLEMVNYKVKKTDCIENYSVNWKPCKENLIKKYDSMIEKYSNLLNNKTKAEMEKFKMSGLKLCTDDMVSKGMLICE